MEATGLDVSTVQSQTSLSCPAKAVIQYAAAARLEHNGLWNTGSPGPVFAKASTRPGPPGAPKL
ncbi:hypothetical protein ACVI1K_000076 [Bradyrhizobium sp. USDA 4508]